MYDSDLAIVDIETTGLTARFNRIIEIAILKVKEGELVDTYSTLVDPETVISPYIEGLTGITNQELKGAPTFDAVRDELMGLLDGALFVAHNARFDYGFLREEFRRAGVSFSPRILCTMRLSRRFFPEHRKHSLDSIMQRFGLRCADRHRALGDAMVVWDFMQVLKGRFREEELREAVARISKTPIYPPLIEEFKVKSLPETPGVYIFSDQEGKPLYVGKSANIKGRVLSHFSAGHGFVKESHLLRQIADVKAIETAGDLGALLLESRLIKEMEPLYNRQSRLDKGLTAVMKSDNGSGYGTVKIEPASALTAARLKDAAGVFKSRRQAKDYLWEATREHRLCPKVMGLEKAKGPCSYRQLGRCEGACEGLEPPLKYNMRFVAAMKGRSIREWPYPGPVVIEEKRDGSNWGEAFVVDKWCILASYWFDDQVRGRKTASGYAFDYDTYKILLHYMKRAGTGSCIRPAGHDELLNL